MGVRGGGFLSARPGVKKFRSIWICFKMWILFQQAAGWLSPRNAPCASARGLPAVYIYPVPSCTDPLDSPPLAASYTTFARALFVHIFASLFCVFRHSPRTPYLSLPRSSPRSRALALRPAPVSLMILFPAVFRGEICFMDTGSLLLYTLLYV